MQKQHKGYSQQAITLVLFWAQCFQTPSHAFFRTCLIFCRFLAAGQPSSTAVPIKRIANVAKPRSRLLPKREPIRIRNSCATTTVQPCCRFVCQRPVNRSRSIKIRPTNADKVKTHVPQGFMDLAGRVWISCWCEVETRLICCCGGFIE